MKTTELKGKRVVVVGLGRSGIAAARYLACQGARVTVNDKAPASKVSRFYAELEGLNIDAVFGRHDLQLLTECDLVVTSPGVPSHQELLVEARRLGLPVVGDLELAMWALDRPIIAVSGTNGKTTTTALIGHLLQSGGLRACVAGNIGVPLLDVLDEAEQSDWVVLELSSFQLEALPSLKPQIAVLLNISPDHLDRHASYDEYAALKFGLFNALPAGGIGIYNASDEAILARLEKLNHDPSRRLLPFDAWKERNTGGWYRDGSLWTKLAAEEASRCWNLEGVSLEGGHNRENMLAALLAALAAKAGPAGLCEGLRSFTPLHHRIEFAGQVNGVRYYDDSKGTNVGATIRALMAFERPIVLIAGGQEKGGGYEPLLPLVQSKVKRLVLMGEAAGSLGRVLGPYVETAYAATMGEAVSLASRSAVSGDVVLLSPACASFDMFENYAARGAAFVAEVKKLESAHREPEGSLMSAYAGRSADGGGATLARDKNIS